jgi:suppressor of tumorigenicity protein 13
MAGEQWTLKVKIAELDNVALNAGKKTKWEKGDELSVSIEPHATVNMMKQRIALIVMAHPKHQQLFVGEGEALEDIVKLEAVEGLTNGGRISVNISVPREPEAPPVVLSDDEGLVTAEEAEAPAAPSAEVMAKQELSDADMDKQGELKGQAQDALEDGDTAKAVALFTEAMMLGGVTAMMVAKRADMLLKMKRYKAAAADATLALSLNPDSAKAFRARGKALRFIGRYEESAADLAQAQSIDYDDGVADLHSYVKKRVAKLTLKAKQDAKKAADEAAAAAAA